MLFYPLGSGCWCYAHARNFSYLDPYLVRTNIFNGCKEHNDNTLIPSLLFNNTLKDLLSNGHYECNFRVSPRLDRTTIGNIGIELKNIESGLIFCHILKRKSLELFRRNGLEKYFDYFEKNKYNFIYTLDFSRCGYEILPMNKF